MKTISFTLCLSLACWANAQEAIDDSKLSTTTDLLRGFDDKELAAAQQEIPPRREPRLGLPRPRLVTVTGRVYEDTNANGKRDADEPLLPNVMVSDGERVLRTGKDGAFHFHIRMDEEPHYRFVVVTRPSRFKPTGSSTPIIAGDLAWFGHDDTSVRAINRAGDVVWEHRLGTPIKTAPAITGNLLLVHDYAGNLWCFAGRIAAGEIARE